MKKRIALLVYVDLDSVPGEFHTEESARNSVAGILDDRIDQYNPMVAHAPDALQPPNCPPRLIDSQEIPVVIPVPTDIQTLEAELMGVRNGTDDTTADIPVITNYIEGSIKA